MQFRDLEPQRGRMPCQATAFRANGSRLPSGRAVSRSTAHHYGAPCKSGAGRGKQQLLTLLQRFGLVSQGQ